MREGGKPKSPGASVRCRQVAVGILPAVKGGSLPPGKGVIGSATHEICNAFWLAHGICRRAGKPGSTAGRMPAATAQGGSVQSARSPPG